MTPPTYKHVSTHNQKWVWRVTVLGHSVHSGEHFDEAEGAACSCQLFKHYLNSEFRLRLADSLEDGEMFSTLAYRRNVDLSCPLSVFSSLTDSTKSFLEKHRAELEAYRSAHPVPLVDNFRSVDGHPMIRDWVDKLDVAQADADAFAAIDAKSFSLRMSVMEKSISTALNSLGLALRMHSGVTNEKLLERLRLLVELETHLQATRAHIEFLAIQFAEEQQQVASALATLEQSRPPLV